MLIRSVGKGALAPCPPTKSTAYRYVLVGSQWDQPKAGPLGLAHPRLRRAGLLVALACFALCDASRATDPKPDFVIKTKVVEASVFLDDNVKADPALAADCLGEGRRWSEKHRAEAETSRKQDPVLFRNGAWSF